MTKIICLGVKKDFNVEQAATTLSNYIKSETEAVVPVIFKSLPDYWNNPQDMETLLLDRWHAVRQDIDKNNQKPASYWESKSWEPTGKKSPIGLRCGYHKQLEPKWAFKFKEIQEVTQAFYKKGLNVNILSSYAASHYPVLMSLTYYLNKQFVNKNADLDLLLGEL